ncbi:MAG: tetratricopeptide repeat protein [Candidatus Hermodarchaeota archaeon]
MSEDNNNIFLKEYKEIREKILNNLEQSNPEQAFSEISQILNYPGSSHLEDNWEDIIRLFGQIIREMGVDQWNDLIRQIIDHPNDADALYDLAYSLYEERLHSIAATLLLRADNIKPQEEQIVSELVINLEFMMLNQEAYNLLSEAKDLLDSSEICRYLLGFNAIMTDNFTKAEKILLTIQNSQDEDIQFMASSLRGMINRASVLKKSRSLDNSDLRGWHMVLNGSILLHLSPYGLEDAMYGRYAYVSDSYSLCRHGIDRVKTVLDTLEIEVPCVLTLPDRSSQILSMATSEILGKPLKFWDEVDINTKGLIVAYDLDEIYSEEIILDIADHRSGQILWAHASCWTYPFPYAPDITTYLHQSNNSPWGGGGMVYNKNLKRVEISEPDKSEEEALSQKIINAEEDENFINDLSDLIALVKSLKLIDIESKPGIFRSTGRRLHQRVGSPVLSNRFV